MPTLERAPFTPLYTRIRGNKQKGIAGEETIDIYVQLELECSLRLELNRLKSNREALLMKAVSFNGGSRYVYIYYYYHQQSMHNSSIGNKMELTPLLFLTITPIQPPSPALAPLFRTPPPLVW
jgi:hypothetical protein